jgi:hypothetical protein
VARATEVQPNPTTVFFTAVGYRLAALRHRGTAPPPDEAVVADAASEWPKPAIASWPG